MLFPFRGKPRNALAVADRIDRYAAINSARLFAGLAVSPGFQSLSGSLIVCEGRGRHLRLRHLESEVAEIPEHLAQALRTAAQPGATDRNQVLQDLAEFQAGEFARLKSRAGKYVDRILSLAVVDPGFWSRDFDGRLNYSPACDATRLSEWTGVNVIDAFPARDLAAGGNGVALEALPFWLWMADRRQRGAVASTALLVLDREAQLYFLPGSDGLDEIVPAIEVSRLTVPTGSHSISQWCEQIAQWLNRPREALPLTAWYQAISPRADRDLAPQIEQQVGLPATSPPGLGETDGSASAPSAWAVASGLLGALFVDQMPANLPALTQASGQRILGRVTPGSPAAWRNLLVCMTDSLAPTMKLKDAI